MQKVIQKVCHNTFGRNIQTVCVRFFVCICVREEEQLRGVCALNCAKHFHYVFFCFEERTSLKKLRCVLLGVCVFVCCVYLVCSLRDASRRRANARTIAIASARRRLLCLWWGDIVERFSRARFFE